jgi:3-deoxy-7-phosphoheptulonate synthase
MTATERELPARMRRPSEIYTADAVRDQRIERLEALVSPRDLLDELPLGPERTTTVIEARVQTHAVLDRDDDRLLVIVGPCSVHDVDATLDYARRLSRQADRLRADLLVTMRVYFEKPRTTTGWKGLINDPHLDGSGDVNTGLRRARGVLLEVLDLGLPVGCEFLDPITPQYISDAVSWGAIGARTVESQTHRQLGSGLSMPVGFKNRTDGNVQVAVDAVRAAAVPHSFAGIDLSGTPAILYTKGNLDCHIILRGGRDAGGRATPNYLTDDVASALSRLDQAGLPERLMIDCSHDNSGKDAARQPAVAARVAEQIAHGNRAIVGTMLESFLVHGRQDLEAAGPGPLTYGQSITDACLGWERTVEVLEGLAGAVRDRRCASRS